MDFVNFAEDNIIHNNAQSLAQSLVVKKNIFLLRACPIDQLLLIIFVNPTDSQVHQKIKVQHKWSTHWLHLQSY